MVSRPRIVGPPSGPTPPFPYRMEGTVISGFGRGSKEVPPPFWPLVFLPLPLIKSCQLGIPTANLPVDDALTPWIKDVPLGVYFGHASLADSTSPIPRVFPMVMSVGYNPFYKNTLRSAEVHVLHAFGRDFYGAHMRLLICGFIRDERDYSSLDALVEDIRFDCDVARDSLAREGWAWDKVGEEADARWLVAPVPLADATST